MTKVIKHAKMRDLTIAKIFNMSEEEAFLKYVELRGYSMDSIPCPDCGVIDKHYFRKNRKQWRCKHCDHYFSMTTRTIFQDQKLGYRRLLAAIVYFASQPAGVNCHQFSRDLDIQIKTALVLNGKLRELLIRRNKNAEKLSGLIHTDGCYTGGRPRSGRLRKKKDPVAMANYVEAKLQGDKKPRRYFSPIDYANAQRRKDRRIVNAVRMCSKIPGEGAISTVIGISLSEAEGTSTWLVKKNVTPGATIMTDEAPAYNALGSEFEHLTVNHQHEFSTTDGVNENQAESLFSRLKRYIRGVGLRSTPKYIHDKAVDIAWRDDFRKHTQGDKVAHLISLLNSHGRSVDWRGYWQGYHRAGEILIEHQL